MKANTRRNKNRTAWAAGILIAAASTPWMLPASATAAEAGMSGPTVTHGQAAFGGGGANTVVTTASERTIIQWNAFGVPKDASAHFAQPTATSATLNRVTGDVPSRIDGSLTSNGAVYVINPQGVMVGPKGRVNTAGGFVASTLDLSDADFINGGPGKSGAQRFFQNGAALPGSVEQYGVVESAQGDVFLLGTRVTQEGTLRAPEGTVGLAAGTEVMILPASAAGAPSGRVSVLAGTESFVDGTGIDHRAGGLIEAASAELRAHGDPYRLAVNNRGVVVARGTTRTPDGRVFLTATRRGGTKANGASNADGVFDGYAAAEAAGSLVHAGDVRATNADGSGGTVSITAGDVRLAEGSTVNVSATTGSGGTAYIGGVWRGGAEWDAKADGAPLPDATTLTVEKGAAIYADGASGAGAGGRGDGGLAVMWAQAATYFAGEAYARGGAAGGDGGLVEVSGKNELTFAGSVDTRAPQGRAGTLWLDPTNLTISDAADSANNINNVTLESMANANNVVLSTDAAGGENGDITVNAAVNWDSPYSLSLLAHGDIYVNAGIQGHAIDPSAAGDLLLVAGWDGFTPPEGMSDPASMNELLSAAWFGNNGGKIVGGGHAWIGNRHGATRMFAHDLLISSDESTWAECIGYKWGWSRSERPEDFDNKVSGDISLFAKNDFYNTHYTDIGHYQFRNVDQDKLILNETLDASGAAITVMAGGNFYLGNDTTTWRNRASHIGHGGYSTWGVGVTPTTLNQDFTANDAPITVIVGGDVHLNSGAWIGHGGDLGWFDFSTVDVRREIGNSPILLQAVYGDLHDGAGEVPFHIGHGGYVALDVTQTPDRLSMAAGGSDITVRVDAGDIVLDGHDDSRIGHFFKNEMNATHSDISVSASGDITLAGVDIGHGAPAEADRASEGLIVRAGDSAISVDAGGVLDLHGYGGGEARTTVIGHGVRSNVSEITLDAPRAPITVRARYLVSMRTGDGSAGAPLGGYTQIGHAIFTDHSDSQYANGRYKLMFGEDAIRVTVSSGDIELTGGGNRIGHGGAINGPGASGYEADLFSAGMYSNAGGTDIVVESVTGEIVLDGSHGWAPAQIGHGMTILTKETTTGFIQLFNSDITAAAAANITLSYGALIGHGGVLSESTGTTYESNMRMEVVSSNVTVSTPRDVVLFGGSRHLGFAQIGHLAIHDGGLGGEGYIFTGVDRSSISVDAGGAVTLWNHDVADPLLDLAHAQIGHGAGLAATMNLANFQIHVTGSAIRVDSGWYTSLSGGSNGLGYAQIGHGGAADCIFEYNISVNSSPLEVSSRGYVNVVAGTGQGAYAQIGHGGSMTDYFGLVNAANLAINADYSPINVSASNGVYVEGHLRADGELTQGQIGHGGYVYHGGGDIGYMNLSAQSPIDIFASSTEAIQDMLSQTTFSVINATVGHAWNPNKAAAIGNSPDKPGYIDINAGGGIISLGGLARIITPATGAALIIESFRRGNFGESQYQTGTLVNQSLYGAEAISLRHGEGVVHLGYPRNLVPGGLPFTEYDYLPERDDGSTGAYQFAHNEIADNGHAFIFGPTIPQRGAIITITLNDLISVYGNVHNPKTGYVTDIDSSGLVDGDTVADVLASIDASGLVFSTDATQTSDVGTYYIRASGLVCGLGYDFVYVDGVLSVAPRPVTITADLVERLEGESNPDLAWSLTSGSFASGQNAQLALVTSADEASPPGYYDINTADGIRIVDAQGAVQNNNYSITYVGENRLRVLSPIPETPAIDPVVPEVVIPETPAPLNPIVIDPERVLENGLGNWDDELEKLFPSTRPQTPEAQQPASPVTNTPAIVDSPAAPPSATDAGPAGPSGPSGPSSPAADTDADATRPLENVEDAALAASSEQDALDRSVADGALRAVEFAIEEGGQWWQRLRELHQRENLDPALADAAASVLEVQAAFLAMHRLIERLNHAYVALDPEDRAAARPYRDREFAAVAEESRRAMRLIQRMVAQLRWREGVGPDVDEMSLRTVAGLSYAIDLAADRLWLAAARLAWIVGASERHTRAILAPGGVRVRLDVAGWPRALDAAEAAMRERVAENRRRRDGMREHLTERRYRQALGLDD